MTKKLPNVSIVIPTLNEADNVAALISRIDAVLLNKAEYELIFIDDHSTDRTVEILESLSTDENGTQRQIIVHTKRGTPGKAFSLIEGFGHASLDLICMIDADLQYPPEALIEMFSVIDDGFDVVVANRIPQDTSLYRRILSKTGRKIFGEWLHGLECDVQSGFKLFRASVLDNIALNMTSWTFDLSFLVQAREKGHKIGTVSIPFSERNAGTSKVNVIRVGLEIAIESIKFKFRKRETLAQDVIAITSDTESDELGIA